MWKCTKCERRIGEPAPDVEPVDKMRRLLVKLIKEFVRRHRVIALTGENYTLIFDCPQKDNLRADLESSGFQFATSQSHDIVFIVKSPK